MATKLEELAEKICENLPLDFTFFEKEGRCSRKAESCDYCKRYGDLHLCEKKTYMSNLAPHTGWAV